MHPGVRHDPLRHREERRCRISPVTDQVDELRVREKPLEQPEVLHVHRRLVPPPSFFPLLRIDGVDRGDRRADRHPPGQPRLNLVQRDLPFRQCVEPAQIVDELVRLDVA